MIDTHCHLTDPRLESQLDDVLKLVKIIREKVFEKNEIHLESEVKLWP